MMQCVSCDPNVCLPYMQVAMGMSLLRRIRKRGKITPSRYIKFWTSTHMSYVLNPYHIVHKSFN